MEDIMTTRMAKLRFFLEEEIDHFQLLAHAARRHDKVSWAYNRAFINITGLLDRLDEKMNNIECTEERVFRETINELIVYIDQVLDDVYYKYQEENILAPFWIAFNITTLVRSHKRAIKRDVEELIPLHRAREAVLEWEETLAEVKAQQLERKGKSEKAKDVIDDLKIEVQEVQDFSNNMNLEHTVEEPEENSIICYNAVTPVTASQHQNIVIKELIRKEEPSLIVGIMISTGLNLATLAAGTALGFGIVKVVSLCGAEISLSVLLGIPVTTAALSLILSATFQVMYEDGDFEPARV
jgi:hypothetical protein